MWKDKVEWIELEDQIGFMKKFINLAASLLETRGALQPWVIYDKIFLEEEFGSKGAINKRKEMIIFRTEHLFFPSTARDCIKPIAVSFYDEWRGRV